MRAFVLNHAPGGPATGPPGRDLYAICYGYGSGPRNDGPLNETLVACSDLARSDPLIGPPLTVTAARGAQIVPGTVPELTVSFVAS